MSGIVLGILALLGVAQPTLLSVAVLVFGGTLFLSSFGSFARAGGYIMVGLAGIVLGILAVVGLSQMTLVLVGLLCLGVGALFGGSAVSTEALSAHA